MFGWSDFNFLHYSQWITLPTQSCLVLYSFCANLLHSLIMWLIIIIIIIIIIIFSNLLFYDCFIKFSIKISNSNVNQNRRVLSKRYKDANERYNDANERYKDTNERYKDANESKVGDCSRGRPEGSLFNCYYAEMLGRTLFVSLDCSTLPLIRTLYCWVLNKEVSSTIFKVFGMTRTGIGHQFPRPLANNNCFENVFFFPLCVRRCCCCLNVSAHLFSILRCSIRQRNGSLEKRIWSASLCIKMWNHSYRSTYRAWVNSIILKNKPSMRILHMKTIRKQIGRNVVNE